MKTPIIKREKSASSPHEEKDDDFLYNVLNGKLTGGRRQKKAAYRVAIAALSMAYRVAIAMQRVANLPQANGGRHLTKIIRPRRP
jgi:hypothetical protein